MTLKSILEFEKKHIRVKLYGKSIGVVSFFMKNTTCGGALRAISWQIGGLIIGRGRKFTTSDSP